jgi:hypothetical protein
VYLCNCFTIGNNGEFTVEVHHGGFLVGSGNLRSYVDEKINWFDYCDVNTWSTLWFNDIAEQLGYENSSSLKVYWLLPGKGMEGLRIMVNDSDTNAMCSVVDRVKTLVLYFDNEDIIGGFSWEDVVVNPVAELPKVISPVNVQHMEKRPEKLPTFYSGLRKETTPGADNDSGSGDDSEDSNYFVDSDNEVDEGDDDLYEEYIDGDVDKAMQIAKAKKGKGSRLKGDKAKTPTDDQINLSSEGEELQLPPNEREGQVDMRFNSFRNEDLNNPMFKVGMVFDSVEMVRAAINEYNMKNRVEIKMPRNDQRRIRAHCAKGCPWTLYVSYDSRVKTFMVKTYEGRHNCHKQWVLQRCTSNWLAEKYIEPFRANDKMTLASFLRTVQKDWNLTPSRSKLARARRIARKKIYGDESEQYNQLWNYGQEIRRSNPRSSFFLNVENTHFSTLYMSLDACKRGFLAGCRPLICLDGCHIKTKFGGQILTAVGIDPNDCIFPIALAVVEVESKASWKWFLETLKQDLGIQNTYPWTTMSDKQKVKFNDNNTFLFLQVQLFFNSQLFVAGSDSSS